MRILFVVDSLSAGGAGRVAARLANELDRQGCLAGIIAMNNGSGFINYTISEKVETVVFPTALDTDIYNRVRRIRDISVKFMPDYMISLLPDNNIYSILAGLNHKNWKLVICERNDPRRNPEPGNKVRLARSLLYRFADGYVFQTDEAKNYFSRKIQKRSAVIPNPVADDIPDICQGPKRSVIVSVASLKKQKNYPMAIQAFAKISREFPDYIYEIYGEGEERDHIERLISQLGLNGRVILKGYRASVLDEIKDASLFIMSSDYEGMSNSMIEALALGIPSIVTDHPIGAPRMLIKDGVNGLLTPVGDVNNMAENMRRVLGSHDLAKRLGMNASMIRRALSVRNICSRWLEFLNKI